MNTTGSSSNELSAAQQALSDIWDERLSLSRSESVKTTQVQGVHHITIVGSTRQSAVDFWQGVLGMPFLFEQPNLSNPAENHLYFDPGDGRLLTVFTNETRQDAGRHAPREIGCVEHLAFNVSRATFALAPARLRERGIEFIERDRGFMDSIYLRDPNGLKVELACYKFETPEGFRAADVLSKAYSLRVERGDHHITEEHLADAIELLLATRRRMAV
jgi:catechol 2,3-dioxygenase-like lactoylglutathione lyase family enzyme